MRSNWVPSGSGRFLAILLVTLIYLLLLSIDGWRFFPYETAHNTPLLLVWMSIGFSELVALLFLAVGALVWLYARSRLVAAVFFGFSLTMMTTFAVETGDIAGDPLLSAIGVISGALALLLLTTLLLLFPRNQFGSNNAQRRSHRQRNKILLLRGYLVVLTLLAAVVALQAIFNYVRFAPSAGILFAIGNVYYLLALVGIVTTIISSYCRISSSRERQQQRLFVVGILLALAPLLLLTVLPLVLNVAGIDGQWTTIPFVVLPLALGYAVLRYQILVPDRMIRPVIATLVGLVGMVLLLGGVVILGNVLLRFAPQEVLVGVAVVTLAGSVNIPRLARRLAGSLLGSDSEMLALPDGNSLFQSGDPRTSLAAVTQSITDQVSQRMGAQAAVLFPLDEAHDCYRLTVQAPPDAASKVLVNTFFSCLQVPPGDHDGATFTAHDPLLTRLQQARRPLLLYEVLAPPGPRTPVFGSRVPVGEEGSLLALIMGRRRPLGMLLLGPHITDSYTGPDFEFVEGLLAACAPLLEAALYQEQVRARVSILKSLYQASAVTGTAPIEVAQTMAHAVASALQVTAELWWADSHPTRLRRVFATSEDQVLPVEQISGSATGDWLPFFYEQSAGGGTRPDSIPTVARGPQGVFAWLPLLWQEQRFGALILIFPTYHRFSAEERTVLKAFTQRCSVQLYGLQRRMVAQSELARAQSLAQQRDFRQQALLGQMHDTLAGLNTLLSPRDEDSTYPTSPQAFDPIPLVAPSSSTTHVPLLQRAFTQLMACYDALRASTPLGEGSSPDRLNETLMRDLETILRRSEHQ
jgi:hypothetical protein